MPPAVPKRGKTLALAPYLHFGVRRSLPTPRAGMRACCCSPPSRARSRATRTSTPPACCGARAGPGVTARSWRNETHATRRTGRQPPDADRQLAALPGSIFGWMDCNVCSLDPGFSDSWVDTISRYVKSLDPRHLFITNAYSYPLVPDKTALSYPDVDAYSAEIYPHWFGEIDVNSATGAALPVHAAAAATIQANKVWFISEYGRTGVLAGCRRSACTRPCAGPGVSASWRLRPRGSRCRSRTGRPPSRGTASRWRCRPARRRAPGWR
jgi:hypothetical protein